MFVGLQLSPRHAGGQSRRPVGGLGTGLLEHAEKHALARRADSVYLLTTTAESFFAASGYRRANRSHAPPFIRSSTEFSSLCPANAAFMVKDFQE